jgi:ABC-type molybdate transport system substrate-binding protein
VERAYRLLGFYYYATSRHEQSVENLMFSFLIQSTLVIEELRRRQYDFTFTTLDALINAIQRRPDLLDYLEDTEYYRTIYYLGAALNATGKRETATQFWTFLSSREEAGIWRSRARSQLQNPFVERAVQMP